jgi:putative DNA primase/helicase
LLCHVNDWTKAEAFAEVRRWFNLDAPGVDSKPRPKAPPRPVETAPTRDLSEYARALWSRVDRSDAAVAGHPYAVAKGITWAAGAGRGRASGRVVGTDADCLLVPIRDIATDAVCAVQAINATGEKQTFGPIKGRALIVGNTLNRSIPWYVCEGWADAVSLVFHKHKGNAAAFGVMGSHFDVVVGEVIRHYAPLSLVTLRDAT